MIYKRILLFILILVYISSGLSRFSVYAEDISPTPVPEPEISLPDTPDKDTLVEEPDITVSPEPFPSDTPVPQETETVVPSPSPVSEDVPAAEIHTNDASNSAIVVNTLNENISGTDIDADDDVILVDPSGEDIPLTQPPVECAVPTTAAPVLNDNYASVENNIDLESDTGGNAASASAAAVETGDAEVRVSVLNRINTNLTGNCAHFGVVNVVGRQEGDIILPYEGDFLSPSPALPADASGVANTNIAGVSTSVDATASTGDNSAQVIDTGTSIVTVRQIDSVNTNITGDNWVMVRVNGADLWTGDFVGWTGNVVRENDYALAWAQLPQGYSSSADTVTNINRAQVSNMIRAAANTGGNTAEGSLTSVTTGNAAARVNILNMINTNITGNYWYYEMINVFETFSGNIVFPRPNLEIGLHTDTGYAHQGYEAAYTITYANRGTLWSGDTVVEALLPAGAEVRNSSPQATVTDGMLRWNIGTLAAGEQASVTFVIKLEGAPVQDVWQTQARIHTSTAEPDQSNNLAVSYIYNILPKQVVVTPEPFVADQREPIYRITDSEPEQSLNTLVTGRATDDAKGNVLASVNANQQDLSTKNPLIIFASGALLYAVYRLKKGVGMSSGK